MTLHRFVALAIVVATTSHASAQTATARGEALFKQGVELRAAGNLADACSAFDASQKADPNLGTLMYLADCREENHELTSAWASFLEAEQRTRNATDDESMQINAAAKERAAKLEPRLSTLHLVVPPAHRIAGLEILIGDEVFKSSAWNLDLPVDGKTHRITARAPGRITWKTTIKVDIERDRKTVDIPLLAVVPPPPPPVAQVIVVDRPEPPSMIRRALPYALVAGGVGSLGLAVMFELSSRSAYDKASVEPEDARQAEWFERAQTQRYKTIGFSIGGIACLGVATWLWVRRDPEQPPPRTSVQPVVGSAFTGVQVGRAW